MVTVIAFINEAGDGDVFATGDSDDDAKDDEASGNGDYNNDVAAGASGD